MKKYILFCGLLAMVSGMFAQQPVRDDLPKRYFDEGREMFLNKNYTGAIHSLNEFLKRSNDVQLAVEADYMLVCASFFTGHEEAELQLKDFLDAHPETEHRNRLCFYIGSCHFNKKEWKRANFWFEQANVDYLSLPEQEDYTFRYAYAYLQNGNKAKARQQFAALSRHSSKYATPASYYIAYIDFREGEYDKALPVFERLKSNSEYKEEAAFFLVQGSFVKNELEKTVADGSAYLRSCPNSKNAKEVYRLLGNSYNRLHDINSSIQYYEKYLSLEPAPLREDMYLLGTSYYQTGNYPKAASALEKAASSADKLGQAACMQLGQCYLNMGANDKALTAFETASRVNFDPAVSEPALYNY
ncbi:MAG: tetratricopeptide repeat protein, partial [Prevotella sp.]|nr:tetratricopeptide repeat protein [Prevotella sp.]